MPKPTTFPNNRTYQRHRRNSGPSLLRDLDAVLLRYAHRDGTTLTFALRDALTDLRHIADIHRLDYSHANREAYRGYCEELAYHSEDIGA